MKRQSKSLRIFVAIGLVLLLITVIISSSNLSTAETASVCVQPPSGLVSWWSGDGNANDIGGSNHGTLQNGATFDVGKIAQAFSLDGVDDYVSIPDDPSLTVSSFTLDAWVYKSSTTSDYKTIVSKYHFDDSNGRIADVSWILYVEPGGGQVTFLVYGTNGESHRGVTTNSAVLTPGAWHFVAATFDFQTQTAKIYVNGVEVPTTLYSGSSILAEINDSSAPVRIGTDFTRHLNAFWDGRIDEVEVFNRVLSASEIQDIFNADSAGKCKFNSVAIDIKPGSYPNSINPKSKGVIPVAILTTDTFDATTVDPLSVTFGPNGAREVHARGHIEDVDADGDPDLVLHFKTQDAGIVCGATSASLTGTTFSGKTIEGADSVMTVGCE